MTDVKKPVPSLLTAQNAVKQWREKYPAFAAIAQEMNIPGAPPGRITVDIPEDLHVALRYVMAVRMPAIARSVPDLVRVVLLAYCAAPGVYQMLDGIRATDEEAIAELERMGVDVSPLSRKAAQAIRKLLDDVTEAAGVLP